MSSPKPRRQGEQQYKLLTMLLLGTYDQIDTVLQDRHLYFHIPSIRTVARLMGTDSKRVNVYLERLELSGLVEGLEWSPNRRAVVGAVQLPPYLLDESEMQLGFVVEIDENLGPTDKDIIQ